MAIGTLALCSNNIPSQMELWKISQALTAKTLLRQGQWHMFYKEFYNFLFLLGSAKIGKKDP